MAELARADRVPVLATQVAWRDKVFVHHSIRHGLVPAIKQQRPHRVAGWTNRTQNAEEIETKEQALRSIAANLGGAESPAPARAPDSRPANPSPKEPCTKVGC